MNHDTFIVDRLEGKYAVCEDENNKMINIELSNIIGTISEGDVLIYYDNFYKADKELTDRRSEQVKRLVDGMWE